MSRSIATATLATAMMLFVLVGHTIPVSAQNNLCWSCAFVNREACGSTLVCGKCLTGFYGSLVPGSTNAACETFAAAHARSSISVAGMSLVEGETKTFKMWLHSPPASSAFSQATAGSVSFFLRVADTNLIEIVNGVPNGINGEKLFSFPPRTSSASAPIDIIIRAKTNIPATQVVRSSYLYWVEFQAPFDPYYHERPVHFDDTYYNSMKVTVAVPQPSSTLLPGIEAQCSECNIGLNRECLATTDPSSSQYCGKCGSSYWGVDQSGSRDIVCQRPTDFSNSISVSLSPAPPATTVAQPLSIVDAGPGSQYSLTITLPYPARHDVTFQIDTSKASPAFRITKVANSGIDATVFTITAGSSAVNVIIEATATTTAVQALTGYYITFGEMRSNDGMYDGMPVMLNHSKQTTFATSLLSMSYCPTCASTTSTTVGGSGTDSTAVFTCSASLCPTGTAPLQTFATVTCQGRTCTAEDCCTTSTTTPVTGTCTAFICPTGTQLLQTVAAVTCVGRQCTASDCCTQAGSSSGGGGTTTVSGDWKSYASIRLHPVTTRDYENGFSNRWLVDDVIASCHDYDSTPPGQLILRVSMGSYIDYFKVTGTLCQLFTGPGQWYNHSYQGVTGPWRAVNGNHSALLGGFQPYSATDKRVWGPFWGAPEGPTGYHAEGGGCCENGDNKVQFWRLLKIDILVSSI